MSPLTSLLARRAIAALIAAAAFTAITDRAGATGLESCPVKANEIASNAIASLWIDEGRLMSCTTIGGRDPQVRRLGTWKSQGHVDLDGGTAVWTQRVKRSGASIDLVFAADLASFAGRPLFVRGVRPAGQSKKAADLRVVGVRAQGHGVAWITKSKVLSAALPAPTSEATRLGEPATDGGGLYGAPLQRGDTHFQLGDWSTGSAEQLLNALRITQVASEDGVCGSAGSFEITVGGTADAPTGVLINSSYAPGVRGC